MEEGLLRAGTTIAGCVACSAFSVDRAYFPQVACGISA
jgi:hypothetical protein